MVSVSVGKRRGATFETRSWFFLDELAIAFIPQRLIGWKFGYEQSKLITVLSDVVLKRWYHQCGHINRMSS